MQVPQTVAALKSADLNEPSIQLASYSPGEVSNETSPASDSEQKVAFVCPTKQTELATKFGSIHIAPGSAALIVGDADAISVYDLHDTQSDAVFLESNGERISLSPGKHRMLTRAKGAEFDALNKFPFVAYRGASKHFVRNSRTFLTAIKHDYDINSLILGFEPFAQMLQSSDPHSRKIALKILKTSAILGQLVGFHM